MIDITFKSTTLRTAVAVSAVHMQPETITLIRQNKIPKGDVLATSRAAGLLAIKNTALVLPLCHPIPTEHGEIRFDLDDIGMITITTTVRAIARTGCEMEALHGAMTTALNIYDMLKPVDKKLRIGETYLKEKSGGKSDFSDVKPEEITAAVVVCSDSISAGTKKDRAGKQIRDKLSGHNVKTKHYSIIPDEADQIQATVQSLLNEEYDVIILTGGTGLSPRDVTPEAVRPLFDREVPGIMEAARQYGMERIPYAMLSRGVAGVAGKSLILTLPGSTRGAAESTDALFPAVLHLFKAMRMETHDS